MTDYDPFPHLLNRQFKDQKLGLLWINRYIKFVKAIQEKRVNSPLTKRGDTHVHHIVPKSWGGPDVDTNLISMTIKEHIVAHHLLCKTLDVSMGFAMIKLMGFGNQKYVDPNKMFNYAIGLRIAADANKARFQQLHCPVCNINTGKIYSSLLDASLTECGNNWSVATAILNNSTANGCYWMRVEDMKDHDHHWWLQQILQNKKEKNIKKRLHNARAVINLTTGQQYASAAYAAEAENCKSDAITDAIRTRVKFHGCMWEFVDNITSIEEEIQKRLQIKQYNEKYKKCYQIIDLFDQTLYETVDDVAKKFNISPTIVKKYICSFLPYKDCHYFVKSDLIREVGFDFIKNQIEEWNRLFLQNRQQYTKTKAVINLSTKERFDSIKEAKAKYPDDNINNSIASHNPAASGCYWMWIDDISKSLEDHLKECQEHYINIGSKKRRLNGARQEPIPVVDLSNNIEYTSLNDYAKLTKANVSNITNCFKKQYYCMHGIILVPKNLLKDIDDIDQFKSQQLELFRLSSQNTAIIDLINFKRYSNLQSVITNTTISSVALKAELAKEASINTRNWIRENKIPSIEYRQIKDKLINIDDINK